jgi:hypothetical protein
MNLPSNAQTNRGGPKEKDKRYTYNESVDETAKLNDAEPVEVEAEVPAEENEPIDSTSRERQSSSAAIRGMMGQGSGASLDDIMRTDLKAPYLRGMLRLG